MDLEHPSISKTLKEGDPDGVGKPLYKNYTCADYSTEGREIKMLSSYAYDELNNFRNTVHKLYQHYGDIRSSVDEKELRVALKDLNTFLRESERYPVEVEKNELSEYTACFKINKINFLLYMNKETKDNLESVLVY